MAALTFRSPPHTSRTGAPIVADTASLARLARDLRRASPAAWKAYRVRAVELATVVMRDAQARAEFSRRIPGSMKVRVTAGGNVKIVGGGEAAPNAAPIENKGKGFVRHPVFGNREVWTEKNSHPAYLYPAFDAHREATLIGLERAVFDAVEAVLEGGGR